MNDRDFYEELDTVMPSKRIANWADESMFRAEKVEGRLPIVQIISGPADPLGALAFWGKTYQGIFPNGLTEISDDDRMFYVKDQEKNILGAPSETVEFHILFRNVTRAFTHQLVRTRHATYGQESMRFAVKEDWPVALPKPIQHTESRNQRAVKFAKQMGWILEDGDGTMSLDNYAKALEQVELNRSSDEAARDRWDDLMDRIHEDYDWFIDSAGWPAEDARGCVPHNILTQVNMHVSLNALMGMAGKRLCTQAQWEWKLVWIKLIAALKAYGHTVSYRTTQPFSNLLSSNAYTECGDFSGKQAYERISSWQYDLLANRFKPICYQTGSCQFDSDFDRYCNIRDRVQANAKIGRSSKEWNEEYDKVDPKEVVVGFNFQNPQIVKTDLGIPVFIPAINPVEWLDPNAAIQPSGDWRTEEQRKNIEGRRR